jgi:hypothetical protein
MEITVHTTIGTWLVEFAAEGARGRDPGWAARQVWEDSQAGQATMRGQGREPADHGWAETRWIVFNPAQVIQVSEPDR